MGIEVREATPDEHAEAGRVTADAYREFVRPGDDDWERYLARIADVPERAGRTTVLVAVEGERILGSLTLELSGRVRDDDDEGYRPLAPGEAHIRRAADKLKARWHVIDTGHYPMLSTPDALARIIVGS